jgi:hypothetical protein
MKAEDSIPDQEQGAQSNSEETVECGNEQEAKQFYQKVKQRLLHVSEWQHWAGESLAHFQLTDERGEEVNRIAREGDHFKIDIPGPGTVTGEGYDWVQIKKISEEENEKKCCTLIQVKPATNPQNDRKDVAHFFAEDATSNFIVKLEGNKVIAAVYGRNEKPNTNTETIIDKARNVAVASGAISGFSKLQWKSLVKGLLKKD